jgi:hypothetical protein
LNSQTKTDRKPCEWAKLAERAAVNRALCETSQPMVWIEFDCSKEHGKISKWNMNWAFLTVSVTALKMQLMSAV